MKDALDNKRKGSASRPQPRAECDRRAELIQTLGDQMSEISEDCYCAGWLGGTEHLVPELCRRALESNAVQIWGNGEVTPERAAGLWQGAKELGHWVDLDEPGVGYVPFNPFPVPAEVVAEIGREQAYGQARQRRARR